MTGQVTTGEQEVHVVGTLAAFGRLSYNELLTVLTTSLLTSIAALPVLTLGAGVLAAVDTMTVVVTNEGRGEDRRPTSERDRVRHFVSTAREHLLRGIPYSVLLVAIPLVTVLYLRLTVSTGSGVFLVGSVLGLYASILVTVWVFRAASVVARSREPPGFVDAMREAGYILLAEPPFTSLQAIFQTVLFVLAVQFQVAVPLLIPGLFAILEVVTFEELVGDGVDPLLYAYRKVIKR